MPMLRDDRKPGIGKNGHRRLACEFAEVANEVSLVEITGVDGDAGPTKARRLAGQIAGPAESKDARKMARRQARKFGAAAAELARAEIRCTSDGIDVLILFEKCEGDLDRFRWGDALSEPGRKYRASVGGVIKATLEIADRKDGVKGNGVIDQLRRGEVQGFAGKKAESG